MSPQLVASCLVLLAVLAGVGCRREPAAALWAGEPTVVPGDTALRFPSGAVFAPGFYMVRYIGRLPAREKAPFLLMEGVECTDCDAPPSVFLRSPSDGPAKPDTLLKGWFAYPGPIREWESKALLSDSRLFWGRCLPSGAAGLVQFSTDSAGRSELTRVGVAEVRGDTIVEWRASLAEVPLAGVVARVRAGECREVPSREQDAF